MDVTPRGEADPTEALPGVHLARVATGDGASLQRFRVEPGATVEAHSHPHEQIGWLAEGELVFVLDDREVTVGAGDAYAIPGGETHGATNPGDADAVGVEAFVPARERPPWAE
jgi:quercetin dioxygenase-like cupin family protein